MKLFHKIFLCFVVIFGITFQTAGCFLIDFAYKNAVEQEKKLAFQNFQYNRYILQSILYSAPEFFSGEEAKSVDIGRSFTVPAAVYGIDGAYMFSNMAVNPGELDLGEGGAAPDGEDDRIFFQIFEKEGKTYIFVRSQISQPGSGRESKPLYLITQTEISSVIEAQKSMGAYFRRIYIVILCVSFPVIFLLTKAITAPIKKVGKAARRIADGEYSERIHTNKKDEIGELAAGFNRMAGQVEEKIAQLSDVARQKEEFAANFAHELKTPLTSVIGYADMLYQRDLPREEVKNAAGYIWNEGMRLEALSLKLMDLFVLDKQDFQLEIISPQEVLRDLEQGIGPVCRRNGVELRMDFAEGSIEADYDLLKTMLLNLADNAVKADCAKLWIRGMQDGRHYRIEIRDDGKGIPPQELGKVTEAFYMVDKSRARKQHGAGLGMALVAKIVEIHRAEMEIESDGKTGTTVRIIFGGKGCGNA